MRVAFILPICVDNWVPEIAKLVPEHACYNHFANRRQGFENLMARAVKSHGHDVSLYFMTDSTKNEKCLTHIDGYQIRIIPSSRFKWPYELSLPLFLALNRELRSGNIDIVHFHEYYSPMVFAISLLCSVHKVPIVVQHHGGKLIGKGILKLFSYFLTLPSLFMASKVLVLNKDEQKILTKEFRLPREKIALVGHGVDVDVFRPIPQNFARSITGLSKRRTYVLFVGRLSDFHKGVSVLLRAFSNIAKKVDNTSLLIVGNGPDKKKLKELAINLGVSGKTQFAGYIKDADLPLYYNSVDIVVVPSFFEAFGIVNIEAMSCGKTVVASNVGGIREIITHKKTGFLISPGNVEELGETILRLLRHPEIRKQVGEAAREEVKKKYSLQSLGKDLDAIYQQSLN
jgi:glycosyltransferase involved in cell wall biosynthesis